MPFFCLLPFYFCPYVANGLLVRQLRISRPREGIVPDAALWYNFRTPESRVHG